MQDQLGVPGGGLQLVFVLASGTSPRLARTQEPSGERGGDGLELYLVVFRLNDEEFGVPVDQVREIDRLTHITALPKAPPGVLGVINLRGRVIPVVSLRERFGFPGAGTTEVSRIVVSDVDGQFVGFVADAVTEVLQLDGSSIEPLPETSPAVYSPFIDGLGRVGERTIILLDLAKVFDFLTRPRVAAEA